MRAAVILEVWLVISLHASLLYADILYTTLVEVAAWWGSSASFCGCLGSLFVINKGQSPGCIFVQKSLHKTRVLTDHNVESNLCG